MPKSLLDRIDVKEPCRESWNEMTGNSEVRFCSHCSKHVHDLSGMTRTRAEKLVRDSGGSLCVRYVRDERGTILHAPPSFTQIKRGASVAARVLTTTLALSTLAVAQGEMANSSKAETARKQSGKSKDPLPGTSFSVTGTVTDFHEAVVPGAEVVLLSASSEFRRLTLTNVEGVFEFAYIDAGEYKLEIDSPGIKKHVVEKIGISGDFKFEKNLVLEIADGIELVGELIVAGDPLICDDPPPIGDKIEGRKIQELPLSGSRMVTLGLIAVDVTETKTDKPKKSRKSKSRLPK